MHICTCTYTHWCPFPALALCFYCIDGLWMLSMCICFLFSCGPWLQNSFSFEGTMKIILNVSTPITTTQIIKQRQSTCTSSNIIFLPLLKTEVMCKHICPLTSSPLCLLYGLQISLSRLPSVDVVKLSFWSRLIFTSSSVDSAQQ